MSEYVIRSAGWSAVVDADGADQAIDRAIASAPDKSEIALGEVLAVVDLDSDAVQAATTYLSTAPYLVRIGFQETL